MRWTHDEITFLTKSIGKLQFKDIVAQMDIKFQNYRSIESIYQQIHHIKKGKKPQHGLSKSIRCITTGEVFPSVRLAAAHCGALHSNIARAARSKSFSNGLEWEYIDQIIQKQ